MMSQLNCYCLAQDKSEMMDCACSGECLLYVLNLTWRSVTVHLVLIKAKLGCLETELRCTEAYWLMFLGLAL